MPRPTPSQTVGPFFGYALSTPGGGDAAPAGHPDTLTVHGYVRDGQGDPVPDALVETWQRVPKARPGSLRRDPVTGGSPGRDGVGFTGFGRVATDADGHWVIRTLAPPAAAPYLAIVVFARGLAHHLHTRAYLDPTASDRLLSALAPERAATLVAREERQGTHRFDIHLQGEKETVFLDFHHD
ncbi:protocatechuate 3,4-dioxygenase subunit alpha [Streptomyces sp. NPDC059076]|uniref:protocatechuate 3,4-dioxygenase subunit alpha n=1 Tax=unclassified Streptomyces TaxID=2593676 RepID=UPI0036AA6422